MPGVRAIFHRANIGKISRLIRNEGFEGITDERRPPLEDDIIRYYGQYVALAVAETFEAAKAAADTDAGQYAKERRTSRPIFEADDDQEKDCRHDVSPRIACKAAGDADTAFWALKSVDQTYVTPAETHRSIELHATIAIGRRTFDALRIDARSWEPAGGTRADVRLAERERPRHHQVRRLGFRQQAVSMDALAYLAADANAVRQPVKLVLSRKMMFQTVGHRPRTQQRVRLGAKGRQARLAPARLRLPPVNARYSPRRLR